MTNASVRSQIFQQFDVSLHPATQFTFDQLLFLDVLSNFTDVGCRKGLGTFVRVDTSVVEDLQGTSTPDAVHRGERDDDGFLLWDLYSGDPGHANYAYE